MVTQDTQEKDVKRPASLLKMSRPEAAYTLEERPVIFIFLYS